MRTLLCRGSAESVIVALVLLTIHLYQQKVFILTGLVYGLAIHLKIYPLVFCLSLYIPLTHRFVRRQREGGDSCFCRSGFKSLFDLNTARVRLVASTVLSLGLLTTLCYGLYGWQFLEETYFYHITRKVC
jgi:phosphatidylinositol glycan class M